MSWHLPHRLTTMHHAVSIALLYSVSSVALPAVVQAATIGKTTITSAQHEPLAATIAITDIDSTTFSAGLANASVYQQMGLTPTDSMSARFVAISETAGQVLISTTQPISMPFADVVLTFDDKGKRNVVPKTLLMPLSNDGPVKPTNPVTASQKPDLPMVSAPESIPLIAKREAPPALVTERNTGAPNLTTSETAADTNIKAAATANKTNQQSSNKAPAVSTTDKQLDILSVEVTRKINAHKKNADNDQNTPEVLVKDETQVKPKEPLIKEPIAQEPLITEITKTTKSKPTDVTDTDTKKDLDASQAPSTTPKPEPEPEPVNTQPTNASSSSYTVQRNDNLWIISQHIAKKNNIDVQTVMTQIQEQNPDAFVDQDASRLKANVQLNLPNYDVLPSQKNIQTAIVAQRQQLETSPKPQAKKAAKPKQQKSSPTQTARTKTTQNMPQGRFSVVAPGSGGNADGTQKKASTATGNGLNKEVLSTLKSSRQRNATQAKRLNATNSALSSYTQKLQLQNQKLADLEARLKKLRN